MKENFPAAGCELTPFRGLFILRRFLLCLSHAKIHGDDFGFAGRERSQPAIYNVYA